MNYLRKIVNKISNIDQRPLKNSILIKCCLIFTYRESETRTDDCFNEELPNENHNYEYFWEINSAFSQWFPCKFVVNGMTYNSAVQYMMHQKAGMNLQTLL